MWFMRRLGHLFGHNYVKKIELVTIPKYPLPKPEISL